MIAFTNWRGLRMTGENGFADLLNELEDGIPIKRELRVEGWPVLWIWRLTPEQIFEIATSPHETPEQLVEHSLKLIGFSVGDEHKPGIFATERGRAWLSRQPNAILELAAVVREFNELGGPSEGRKKKSETAPE